jgi:hypothetical protein
MATKASVGNASLAGAIDAGTGVAARAAAGAAGAGPGALSLTGAGAGAAGLGAGAEPTPPTFGAPAIEGGVMTLVLALTSSAVDFGVGAGDGG